MRSLFRVGYHFLRQLIAPPFCASCRIFLDDDGPLCVACMQSIVPVVSHELSITQTKRMRVFALGSYQPPLRSLILAKSSGQRMVTVQLGRLLWRMGAASHLPFDLIVPIPLHWTRYAWRGYNQSEEIARVIAHESKKPMAQLLKRIKRTPYLTYYAAKKRQSVMQAVFQICDTGVTVQDKDLLLIDDVMTSGATLTAAARELWKLKPRTITACVIARAV